MQRKPVVPVAREVDVVISCEGSVYLVDPRTQVAKTWIENHVDPDAQWFGGRLVVEHRYIADLAQGMATDGLYVSG